MNAADARFRRNESWTASLEGALVLEYQRFQAQAKGLPDAENQTMTHEVAIARARAADPDESAER